MFRIAILGFSREGRSALRFLKKQRSVFGKRQKEVEYWILDYQQNIKLPTGIKHYTGENYLAHLDQFDLVIRSPGVPYMKKELRAARRKNVVFTSPTRIFFDACPGAIIGVTGTKGKGTTATMLYQILKAANKKVVLVGNIGRPALDLLPKIKKDSLVVFELSSFQLQDLTRSPAVAIVLGINPDHLDSHKNFKEYIESKSHIASYQKKNDWVFYDDRNKYSCWIANQSQGHKVPIHGTSSLFEPSDLYLPAPHLVSNAALATAVARKLGVSKLTIKRAVKKFRGYEHRLELVRRLKNIDYYNDSAATTPLATIAAIRSFKKPIVLIAGGKDKKLDYKEMVKVTDHSPVKFIVFVGENKKKLMRLIRHTPYTSATSLEEALHTASQQATAGDIVLLSPGATSFDMFQNYAERGKVFKTLVKRLK